MKAMILAAGLGTRLRPWTLTHPKALVPVGGIPMLQRVIESLRKQRFDDITVNVHHFADQITDFIASHDFGVKISVSDETGKLLDTGGALLHALPLLDSDDDRPFLVHNVDILTDAHLADLMKECESSGSGASLLVSERDSSRRLVFDAEMNLHGWHNISTGAYRPEEFWPAEDMREFAFSGIYAMRPSAVRDMAAAGFSGVFSVIDYLLSPRRSTLIKGICARDLSLIDIGKPATLSQANLSFANS